MSQLLLHPQRVFLHTDSKQKEVSKTAQNSRIVMEQTKETIWPPSLYKDWQSNPCFQQ